jgi:hypothetical protein
MFSRKMMSLLLPALVLTVLCFLPGAVKAGGPSPSDCCGSLVNVEVEFDPTFNIWLVNNEPVLSYDVVNIGSFWNDVDILTFEDILSHNDVASYNEAELTYIFGEVNVLSENQVVVGLINGVVYYLDNH